MSNHNDDIFFEDVKERVEEIWKIEDREDLLIDCIDYVIENIGNHRENWVSQEPSDLVVSLFMLDFFQSISHNAISQSDIENMKEQYEKRPWVKSMMDALGRPYPSK